MDLSLPKKTITPIEIKEELTEGFPRKMDSSSPKKTRTPIEIKEQLIFQPKSGLL